MKAFTGTIVTKEEMVNELKLHQEADSFMKGRYKEEVDGKFKGCAVGCSLESISRLKSLPLSFSDHSRYEDLMGVPSWIARVEDMIFEGLSIERSKQWPLEFTEAINVGADLNKIKAPFLVFILRSTLEYVQDDKHKKQKDSIQGVIDLWLRDDVGSSEWESSRKTARSAAMSAAAAASAESTESTAWYAARSATEAAESAARSAARSAEATRSAAWSAWAAAYAAGAAGAARKAKYDIFADELLRLIKECV